MDRVKPGDVLVTDMTDPDWEPVMKRAAAIVTNRGGRTCHAAIIARELGIPAVVGCGNATDVLKDGMQVTVSCSEGDTGNIYDGLLEVEIIDLALDQMPDSPVKIMMNVGNPELAFDFCQLPNEGVGLARMEFVINRQIGIHPKALLELDSLSPELQADIRSPHRRLRQPGGLLRGQDRRRRSHPGCGVLPEKVIVRMSDFKSNEYANLVGGSLYEPHEENPMIGFRARPPIAPEFRDCFELECRAIRKVRDVMGLTNVEVMIPFVRTLKGSRIGGADPQDFGLERGKNGLRLIMMCELPTNAVLAEQFLEHFDGFSIGSNDMTQLTLGVDRDSGGPIAPTFDEARPGGESHAAHGHQRLPPPEQVCRHLRPRPVRSPGLRQVAGGRGIETISLNPDTVVETWLYLARKCK